MTAKQCFEGLLTELSKVNAPSMLLQDFNYFFNKAVNQYINKRYNIYDINQQTTDDLRVLKASTLIDDPKQLTSVSGSSSVVGLGAGASKLFGGTYYINLPLDYLHMLNCVCIYRVNKRYKCYDLGDYVQFAAKRLTGDSWSTVLNDFYNRPLPERPYYYINNVNQSNDLPTNPIEDTSMLWRNTEGTDARTDYLYNGTTTYVIAYRKGTEDSSGAIIIDDDETEVALGAAQTLADFRETNPYAVITRTAVSQNSDDSEDGASNLPRTINLDGFGNISTVEREAGVRYGNSTGVRCEIRYGHDNTVFELTGVLIDYIKAPQTIRLTQELVNLTEDHSLILEFPDYVCQEIINELVHLVMENTADPRLQTHNAVTQSIANPVQQLAQPTALALPRRQAQA